MTIWQVLITAYCDIWWELRAGEMPKTLRTGRRRRRRGELWRTTGNLQNIVSSHIVSKAEPSLKTTDSAFADHYARI